MRATSLIKSVIDNSAQPITHYYQSPCGVLGIIHNNTSVLVIRWGDHDNLTLTENNTFFDQVRRWLDCYFSGQEPQSCIELTLAGTDFQRRVWIEMSKIAPGTTKTYGEVAALLNSSARGLGGACRANPAVIIVRCHRIVAANGVGGYSGKTQGLMLDRKCSLLTCDKELSR